MIKTPFAQSLSGRLLLLGVLPAVLAIGLIVVLADIDSYRNLGNAEKRVLEAYAVGAAGELSTRNSRWNNVAALMANAQMNGMFGKRDASLAFVKSVLATFTGIIGAYVAYEPNADGQDAEFLKSGELPAESLGPTGRFLPYWYTETESRGDGSGLKLKVLTDMETLEYYRIRGTISSRTAKPCRP
jgi:hypothetical protein